MSASGLTVFAIITSSFSFTASLLWNDFIQIVIARYFPDKKIDSFVKDDNKPSARTMWVKFAFALGFTVFIIFLLLSISHFFHNILGRRNFSVLI